MSNRGKWGYGHAGEPKDKERRRLEEVALAAKQYMQKMQAKSEEEEAISRRSKKERQLRAAEEGSYWPWGYGSVVSSSDALPESERERRREVAAAARHYSDKYLTGKNGETAVAAAPVKGPNREVDRRDGASTTERASADAGLQEKRILAASGRQDDAVSDAAAAAGNEEDADVEVASADYDAAAGVETRPADAFDSEQRARAAFGRGNHKDQLQAFARFLSAFAAAMEARERRHLTSAAGQSSDDEDDDGAAVEDFLAAAEQVVHERSGAQRAGRWLDETLDERQRLWQLLEAIAALQDAELERSVAGGRRATSRDEASSTIADALSAAVAYVAERAPAMHDRGQRLETAINWNDEIAWLSDDSEGGDRAENRAGGEVE